MAESCLSCKRIVNNSLFFGPVLKRNCFSPVCILLWKTHLYFRILSRHNPVKRLWREKEAQENEVWNPHPRRGFHTKWTLRRRGVNGQRYLNFWLSMTASSSQRLFHSFSAWPCVGTSSVSLVPPPAAELTHSAVPPFPTGPASLGSGGGPFGWVKGQPHLNLWLSMTASSSQRLFHSFSAWPLTQW